ncbi:heat-shock protein IbpA [Marinobacterium zhoushanense]|uniref:Heat-shock protein IbpA n=1 Tax=Marinobacterium zhoushanense TaxID=1679163 RepID=A0ABQ1KAM1_9GAMM|nr:Hsp20 family protein [Marinobacterium zhoushanense]GGB90540.1 heat-shock protein IbpA [Marinobacterium zhoushanense]
MRNFDLSPLYRSAIGFDRLASMLDAANRSNEQQPSYPPYNIELLGENEYRITMAVAGFNNSEIDIQTENGNLTITGRKEPDEQEHKYLYQGIAARNFERRFQLADHVRVVKAALEHGLLHVDLVREIPEAMKSRRIEIN